METTAPATTINENEIQLTLKRRETIELEGVFYEVCDEGLICRILSTPDVLVDTFHDPNADKSWVDEPSQVKGYLGNITRKKYKTFRLVKVSYKRHKLGWGRVYAKDALGLINFRRQLRQTMGKNEYLDIDIKNAHPTMLMQICKKYDIECPLLEHYCNNRMEILNEVKEHYGVGLEDAKNLFIVILYFGGFNGWVERYNKNIKDAKEKAEAEGLEFNKTEIEDKEPTEFIKNFIKELRAIGAQIVTANEELKSDIEKYKKDLGKKNKAWTGSIMSYYLQEHECRLLGIVFKFLKEKGVIENDIVSFCYDGLMILKDKYYDGLLDEIMAEVKAKSGFDLLYLIKPMDEDFMDKLVEAKHSVEIENEETSNFNFDECVKLVSYEDKKTYFEKYHCKVEQPCLAYVKIMNIQDNGGNINKRFIFMKETEMSGVYKQLRSGKVDKQGNETKFITEWLNDQQLRRYDYMDFRPYNGCGKIDYTENGLKILNLFAGYNNVINYSFEKEDRDTLIKPWRHLVYHLCGGVKKHLTYFEHFIAHMIKYPNKKLDKSIIIKGQEGTGKNTALYPIGAIINKEHFISSANPDDFFGNHAEGFYHKLLVNMNECEGKSTFQYEGKIKSFITEDKVTINPKFERPTTVDNLSRLIIFSNKQNPIYIGSMDGDRRWVVFETTSHYIDTDEETGERNFTQEDWRDLNEYFKKPEFLSALYDYFNSLDVDNYDFTKNRPITKAYKAMVKRNIPAHVLFLEEFIGQRQFEYLCRHDIKKGIFKVKDRKVEIMGEVMNNEHETLTYDEYVLMIPQNKEECTDYNNTVSFVGAELFNAFNKWCDKYKYSKIDMNFRAFYDMLHGLNLGFSEAENNGVRVMKFTPKQVWDGLVDKKLIILKDEDYNIVEMPAETVEETEEQKAEKEKKKAEKKKKFYAEEF